MWSIKNKLTYENLFLIVYACWLFIAVISISSMYLYLLPWIPYGFMRYGCILVMMILQVNIMKSVSSKELIGLGIAAVVVVSLMHFWGSIYCESLLIVMLSYKIDFKRLSKVTIIVVLAAILFVIASSLVGIIQNYNYKTHNDTRDRFGLGFRYATYPTHYILLVVLLTFYVKREEISYKQIIPLVLLNLFVYSQSHSRNSMMLSFAVILCALFFKRTNFYFRNNLFNKIALAGAYVYLACFQLILAAIYDPSKQWMAKLNVFMSERLRLNAHAYQTYKFTILGQITNFETRTWQNGVYKRAGSEYTGMDSSYLGILYRNGILSLAFFLVIFTVAGIYALKKRDRYLTVILLVVAAHSTFDPQLNLLQYNTFLILAFSITIGTYRENLSAIFRRVLNNGKKQQNSKKLYI